MHNPSEGSQIARKRHVSFVNCVHVQVQHGLFLGLRHANSSYERPNAVKLHDALFEEIGCGQGSSTLIVWR